MLSVTLPTKPVGTDDEDAPALKISVGESFAVIISLA
jgi:hypothetical protein